MSDDVKLCLDILGKAIAFEEEGIRFFDQQAGNAGAELERRIFHSLAKDEAGHREYLVKLRDDLLRTHDMKALGAQDDHQHRGPREIFETALAGAQSPYTYVPQDLEILRGAMQVERKGFAMYSGAANVTSPLARELFLHLAEEEQNHFQLLSNTHDYLENPEQWNGYDESPMLDGG